MAEHPPSKRKVRGSIPRERQIWRCTFCLFLLFYVFCNASWCPGRDMLATMRDRSLRATGDAPIHTQVSSDTQVPPDTHDYVSSYSLGLCSAAPAYHQLGVQSWRRPAARGTRGLMLAAQRAAATHSLSCKLHVSDFPMAQLSKCTFSYHTTK